MTKLQGQAFDTEKFYGELGAKKMEEYAIKTGLWGGSRFLDSKLLLKIVENSFEGYTRVLEVGCGYGRVAEEFLNRYSISYYGIDLHKPFIDIFKKKVDESQRNQIFWGNFLDFEFPFREVDCILFPWSVIGDFSSGEGQIATLEKASLLLYHRGKILIDIPKDIINEFEGYAPGHFNVHEKYDLAKVGLKYNQSHPYTTYTDRKREILELHVKNH
ncbi:MAG: class I SAM-dependent methyltransferase [Nanoarchaeota archaeon]